MTSDLARIFVGADRSQLIAVKVLEFSIARRTNLPIHVRSMHDLDLPEPTDIRHGKRTGFSFTRFAIPALCHHTGRALYLDADMLVLRDLRELYELPFSGAKVLVQEEPAATAKGARRIRQSSVMLLDCGALDWDAPNIIAGLGKDYSYEQLLHELCILRAEEIGSTIPFAWNSLETYESGRTGLLHYTDMQTQPWVNPANPNGYLWIDEVRDMIAAGAMTLEDLAEEIRLGYVRPSLLVELEGPRRGVSPSAKELDALRAIDAAARFQPHAEVYAQQKKRQAAIAAAGGAPSAFDRVLSAIKRRLNAS